MVNVITSEVNVKTPSHILPNSPVNNEKNSDDCENLEGIIIDNWNVHEIIGKGAFGYIYRCSTKTKDGTIHEGAIKCEKKQPNNNTSCLKVECTILLKLIKNGDMGNFTVLYSTGERHNFDYMIMTLLGPNLFDICAYLPKEKMEIGTWVRVMYQALSAIQSLHEIRYVHLDIKPANFALGHKNDSIRYQVVHLLDFGLSRKYGSRTKPIIPTYCNPKQGVEYVGTVTHCSPHAHSRVELSRRDDMWSWLFMCMDLYNELPWRELHGEDEIENLKKTATYEHYCDYLPKRCHILIEHIMKLGTYDYPDYDLCFTQLLFIMKDKNIKVTDPYQWENLPTETKKLLGLKIDSKSKVSEFHENMKQRLDFLNKQNDPDSTNENSKSFKKDNKCIFQQLEKVTLKDLELDVTQKSDSMNEINNKKCASKNKSTELKINKKKKASNNDMKDKILNDKKSSLVETKLYSPKYRGMKKKENSPGEVKVDLLNRKSQNSIETKKTQSQTSVDKSITPKYYPTKSIQKCRKSQNNEIKYKNVVLPTNKKDAKRRKYFKKLPAVNYDPNTIGKIQKRFKDNMLQKYTDKMKAKEVIEKRILKEKNSINKIKKMNDDYKQFLIQITQTE